MEMLSLCSNVSFSVALQQFLRNIFQPFPLCSSCDSLISEKVASGPPPAVNSLYSRNYLSLQKTVL